eukprot:TRINITY_DN31604_c0_g1_i2.p1 TRINITY_DN31604_c0_g1~~TRINITY_DN31604_c0_g1_i2.p1  ORF type:complete len:782 (+),score=231.42 TRINITY_DN31604_c0_g1_i2:109-2454(+)
MAWLRFSLLLLLAVSVLTAGSSNSSGADKKESRREEKRSEKVQEEKRGSAHGYSRFMEQHMAGSANKYLPNAEANPGSGNYQKFMQKYGGDATRKFADFKQYMSKHTSYADYQESYGDYQKYQDFMNQHANGNSNYKHFMTLYGDYRKYSDSAKGGGRMSFKQWMDEYAADYEKYVKGMPGYDGSGSYSKYVPSIGRSGSDYQKYMQGSPAASQFQKNALPKGDFQKFVPLSKDQEKPKTEKEEAISLSAKDSAQMAMMRKYAADINDYSIINKDSTDHAQWMHKYASDYEDYAPGKLDFKNFEAMKINYEKYMKNRNREAGQKNMNFQQWLEKYGSKYQKYVPDLQESASSFEKYMQGHPKANEFQKSTLPKGDYQKFIPLSEKRREDKKGKGEKEKEEETPSVLAETPGAQDQMDFNQWMERYAGDYKKSMDYKHFISLYGDYKKYQKNYMKSHVGNGKSMNFDEWMERYASNYPSGVSTAKGHAQIFPGNFEDYQKYMQNDVRNQPLPGQGAQDFRQFTKGLTDKFEKPNEAYGHGYGIQAMELVDAPAANDATKADSTKDSKNQKKQSSDGDADRAKQELGRMKQNKERSSQEESKEDNQQGEEREEHDQQEGQEEGEQHNQEEESEEQEEHHEMDSEDRERFHEKMELREELQREKARRKTQAEHQKAELVAELRSEKAALHKELAAEAVKAEAKRKAKAAKAEAKKKAKAASQTPTELTELKSSNRTSEPLTASARIGLLGLVAFSVFGFVSSKVASRQRSGASSDLSAPLYMNV